MTGTFGLMEIVQRSFSRDATYSERSAGPAAVKALRSEYVASRLNECREIGRGQYNNHPNMHLIYPIDSEFFHQRIQPVLAQCWRRRSFHPGQDLWRELLGRIGEFHADYHGLAAKTLVGEVAEGLAFDRQIWRALVGEVLVIAAEQLPVLHISPMTLRILLAGENFGRDVPRSQFAPIEQALFGSRDLVFGGGFYRPDHAGWNDLEDGVRLAEYLGKMDPLAWEPAHLQGLTDLPDDEERNEELEFTRQNWPGLVEVYVQAREKHHVVICEQ